MKNSNWLLWLCVICCGSASAAVHYVGINSSNPVPPYADWSTAATNIQDAIDVADAGDQILVTNGVYASGGRVIYGSLTNRVAITKPLTVQSVNGPEATIIQGYQVPGTISGDASVRCVYMTNGALLAGFTTTGGATRRTGTNDLELDGGGIWCESTSAMVTNCILTGNAALGSRGYGGGIYFGGLINCTISNNAAGLFGGGAGRSYLTNCLVVSNTAAVAGGGTTACLGVGCRLIGNQAVPSGNGGGDYSSTMYSSLIFGNYAGANGGGGEMSRFYNCALLTNSAASYGGGVNNGYLDNCTVVGNTAAQGGGLSSEPGGASSAGAFNSIIYYNSASTGSNYFTTSVMPVSYTCTTPWPPVLTNYPDGDVVGGGNVANEPGFVSLATGNLRPRSDSPCINAGHNGGAFGTMDLDGNLRIVGGAVDLGAYEYQTPASIISYAWLQYYGLPTDGSADFADPDHDGMSNWKEWMCGTDPTNALSVLRLLSPTNTAPGMKITWQSVNTRTYYLQRASNLAAPSPFVTVGTNLAGRVGTTTFTDLNATGAGPFFYRIGVQQ